MATEVVKRSVGTHDGPFHADEVTACALLLVAGLIDRDRIVRTRDPLKLAACEYVCDVGGEYNPDKKLFDHHQVTYQGDLSSAGMVLQYLRDVKIFEEDIYEHLRDSFVAGVDAHDNGRALLIKGWATFSLIIAQYCPIAYDATDEEHETAFFQALDFVVHFIHRLIERHRYVVTSREQVREAMDQALMATNPVARACLLFDKKIPWLENFFVLGGATHPASFVVMPSGDHWKLRCIPPNWEERMGVRLPLPKAWAGLLDEELQRVSGIPGAVFCHKGRFISVWETKEEALRAVRMILEGQDGDTI